MNETYEFNGEVISFPVPKRYLPVVIRALAEAMDREDLQQGIHRTEGDSHQQSPQSKSAQIDWSDVENCRRLRTEMRYPGALAMLNLTAARPGVHVSFQEIVTASKLDREQVRAELGALTKTVRRLFGVSREDARWPAQVHWASGEDQQAYYVMRSEVARAWTQSQSSN
jgi:hypothetical protein